MANTQLCVPKEAPNLAESKRKTFVKRENYRNDNDNNNNVVVNLIQSQISKVSLKDFFFQRFHHGELDNYRMIPKNIVSVDDKYLRRCLELIRISASTTRTLNSGQFIFECPVGKNHENLSRMNFGHDDDANKGLICYNRDSPSGFSVISSSSQLEKESLMIKGKKFMSQGMLQCTWKEGIPHFVFSADDEKEVYVTKLSKDKALDYVYLFHSNNNSQLVGTMNVSTSFTLGSDNDKVRETEFVLFGSTSEVFDKEKYGSNVKKKKKKKKRLSKKVSQVFKTSPFSKLAIEETCAWEPLESNVAPNLELAAIVVKTHNALNSSDHEVGGWGLKFLNQSRGVKKSTASTSGDFSTSISVLIPAGLHGGPRTENGGPSSLIDRWRSGGHCDCGGWDEGCPLTVLQRRSLEASSEENMEGECKTVDLVTQGSRDFIPKLRMVNVHDGLYFIQFQPPLSALQSFSIAVAIIHSQSSTLFDQYIHQSRSDN